MMGTDYWRDGYVIRRQLVPKEMIDTLNQRFAGIADGAVAQAPNMQIARNVEVAKGFVTPRTPAHGIAKVNFVNGDPVLSRYAHYEPIIDEVQKLIGDDLIALNSMFLNKPTDVDGRHPLHQDLLYFPLRPADRIVGVWTALDAITRENGCLVVLPGTHTGELLEHDYPDWEHQNFLFFGAKGIDVDQRVHLEMDPGDTLFFHPLLVHGSGYNRTENLRRAIAVHYASSHCEDIWRGETKTIGDFNPRLDIRLIRGQDPRHYAHNPATSS